MSRILAYTIGFGIVVAAASPAWRPVAQDSFPLSTYPMFSQRREKPRLFYAEGETARGEKVRLPHRFVANDEVLQATVNVRRAIEGGEGAMDRLCTEIANRVASDRSFYDVQRISLVSAQFDPVLYFVQGPTPEEFSSHHSCVVSRP